MSTDEATPTSPPTAETCQTETEKIETISDKCKKIGKGKSGYNECVKEYNAQKTKARQTCRE